MICITGSPGSGKSTVARELRKMGYKVLGIHDIPGAEQCIRDQEADLECLSYLVKDMGDSVILEGHYSHLMGCSYVFILYRDEERIKTTLESRGYDPEKVKENLDAQRCDQFFSESLDLLPRGRIFRIEAVEGNPEATAIRIDTIMRKMNISLLS